MITRDVANWLTGDWQKLDPDTASRLATMAKRAGKAINITSGYRSVAEQQVLWDKYGHDRNRVAPPGKSRHNFGYAVDVGDDWVKNLTNDQLRPFGLTKPLSNENWHIEPIEKSKR